MNINPIAERRIHQVLSHISQLEEKNNSTVFCENKTSSSNSSVSAPFPNYQSQYSAQLHFMETSNSPRDGQSSSKFGSIDFAPADPILGLNVAFKADTSSKKVNLGVGAYRTEEGDPWVLPVVRKVEQQLLDQKLNKEYIPQEGLPEYLKVTGQLVFGKDSKAIQEKRLCVIQSLSGTGALRLGFEFIKKFYPKGTMVYVSDPTWANHFNMLSSLGIPYGKYRYYDSKTKLLDFQGMMSDLENAPNGSVVLLHLCAHNPSGNDPNQEQWKQIAAICKRKSFTPFFDSAYQGFASGDLDRDAWAIRHFADELGMECMCAQSYAKNFGLYGERIGALHFVCKTADQAERILSQMRIIVRVLYSSPQLQGARIVAAVLSNPQLFEEWKRDLRIMSDRIISMRHALFDALKKRNTPGTWDSILKQIGMFSYTGLTEKQVTECMTKKYHIYLTKDGRISMAGLNTKNVDYVADAIDDAVRNF